MSENFIKAFGDTPKAFVNTIYALCDIESLEKRSLSLDDFILIAKQHSVSLIQYRNKISDLQIQENDLKYLKKHLDIPIIINDKVELVAFADGLHLGQDDFESIHKDKFLAIKLIRKKIGNKLLGLSTHNEMEILEANELDLDMIGLGAYRATSTKDVDTLLGDKLPYLAKMSRHPVCAIGGVKKNDNIDNIVFKVIGSDLYNDQN